MKEKIWHSLTINKVLTELKTSPNGLTEKEAETRLKKFGSNKLPKKPPLGKTVIFVNQFRNSLVIILLIAAIISFFLGDFLDGYVILAAVLLNVVIGFIQENKAQDALLKLKKFIITKAKVIREGKEQLIEYEKLVPGDIILLTAGDRLPADGRLMEVNNFEVEEAPLTGESVPVEKLITPLAEGTVLADRENMVYQGTVVLKGKAKAIITSTGQKTEIGKIASQLKEVVEEATPLQKKLGKFSRTLAFLILFLCLIIFLFGVLAGQPVIIMFNTAVAIAVSAIPEGLLVSVTVILALGMQAILKKNALVRRLISAETLGSTTIICTDKTGTLTTGEMRVAHLEAYNRKYVITDHNLKETLMAGREILLALKIGMLCNEAVIINEEDDLNDWQIISGATDKALILAGAQAGLRKKQLEKETPLIEELPFDSEKKYMISLRELDEKENIIYVKGAPEKILEKVAFVENGEGREKIDERIKDKIKTTYENLSHKGLRVLALAYHPVAKKIRRIKEVFPYNKINDLTWVGLVGIKDPLRLEAKETIKLARKAGLKVVILTGDNRLTARAIAEELGLVINKENILDGEELLKINDEELVQRIKNIKIFSRVSPQDKLRIVQAWSARGEIVAMTGDGINDAPALKQANIGIALGSGTEVAKETADLVLLDNNFSTIIAAIEQGRVIYDNIRKVVLYLLSDSFSEIFLIFGSLLLALPLPVLPAQILWVNLVNDSLPNLALTKEPEEKEIMLERPQERNKPIVDKERRVLIAVVSLTSAFFTLVLFFLILKFTNDLALARTVAFTNLAVDSLFYIFSCRSLRKSVFNRQIFSNKYLIGAVIISFIFQLLAVYWGPLQSVLQTKALSFEYWLLIITVSILLILIIELVKWIFFGKIKKPAL